MSNLKFEADSTTSSTTQSPSAPLPTVQRPPTLPETSRQRLVASQAPVVGAESSDEPATSRAPKADSPRNKTCAETFSPSHKSVETQSTSRPTGSQSIKEELLRRQERARALFEKYDVPFDTSPWDVHPKSQSHVERVHKPHRIRVRWTCHECQTTFGHNPTCVECAHHRCRNCPRNPPKRSKTKAAKAATQTADRSDPPNGEGQEGRCHECQAIFQVGIVQECSNCHHQICDRCLQEILSADRRAQTSAV